MILFCAVPADDHAGDIIDGILGNGIGEVAGAIDDVVPQLHIDAGEPETVATPAPVGEAFPGLPATHVTASHAP